MKNLILNTNPFATFLLIVAVIAAVVLVFAVVKLVKNKKQINDTPEINEEKEGQIYFPKKFLTTYE